MPAPLQFTQRVPLVLSARGTLLQAVSLLPFPGDSTSACLWRGPSVLWTTCVKHQLCRLWRRPHDQLGELPQPGQKAMGPFVQQFDATWRKIGLREAQKGKMIGKAAPLPAPLPAPA